MTARERYVQAICKTNEALKSLREAAKDTTLVTSLLLDLFEKITNGKPRNNRSWKSHVDGALSLVIHRGLERFQDPAELRILFRLSTNYIISCVASSSPVPDELIAIRKYVGNHLDVKHPKWRLSELMVFYANLLSDIRKGVLPENECIARCEELDRNLRSLDFDMPQAWQISTTSLDAQSERAFKFQFDSYADRNVTQARNVLRTVRILLNEALIGFYLTNNLGKDPSSPIAVACSNVEILAGEICSSVQQYVDCDGPARTKIPASERSETSGRLSGHPHTPNHVLDCYTLLFPVFVAARSPFAPVDVQPWVIKQLHYIGGHFCIRNAELVAQILEVGTDAINPWELYAMLGSYAFAA